MLPQIGIGVDVHKFADNSDHPLFLAGLIWENYPRLLGHSDGDVVAHAAADAIFSAAGLGDLGYHFGTDRSDFSGISGVSILRESANILCNSGYTVGNVSVQIVGNKPKFADRRNEAQKILGAALGANIFISATTTDGLGLTGRGEGIAAVATALVTRI